MIVTQNLQAKTMAMKKHMTSALGAVEVIHSHAKICMQHIIFISRNYSSLL